MLLRLWKIATGVVLVGGVTVLGAMVFAIDRTELSLATGRVTVRREVAGIAVYTVAVRETLRTLDPGPFVVAGRDRVVSISSVTSFRWLNWEVVRSDYEGRHVLGVYTKKVDELVDVPSVEERHGKIAAFVDSMLNASAFQ